MVEGVAGDVGEGLVLGFWGPLAEEAAIGKVRCIRTGTRNGED